MNYDTWKTGYDFEDYRDSSSCNDCVDINQKFDQCIDFLEGIRDQLYGRENFNREILDCCVEELCFLLNVKKSGLTEKDLVVYSIKQKENKLFNFSLGMARQLSRGVL